MTYQQCDNILHLQQMVCVEGDILIPPLINISLNGIYGSQKGFCLIFNLIAIKRQVFVHMY